MQSHQKSRFGTGLGRQEAQNKQEANGEPDPATVYAENANPGAMAGASGAVAETPGCLGMGYPGPGRVAGGDRVRRKDRAWNGARWKWQSAVMAGEKLTPVGHALTLDHGGDEYLWNLTPQAEVLGVSAGTDTAAPDTMEPVRRHGDQ